MMNDTVKNCRYGLANVFFTWDIQYRCNYRCSYCFLNFEKETQSVPAVYLKPEEWIRIWNHIYDKYGGSHIHITGGEPFTYPGFLKVLQGLAVRHSMAVSTNLSFDAEEFMRHVGPEKIRVEASFHREFVNIGDFIKKVKLLRDNDYFTSITVVAYPPFLKDIKEAREFFSAQGFKLILYPYRGPWDNREYPDGYTEKEKGLLAELGLSIADKVSKNLQEAYSPPAVLPAKASASGPSVGYNQGGKNASSVTTNFSPEVVTKQEEQKICLMGHMYAKIMPDGEAFRCCNSVWNKSKDWENWGGLGNIVEGKFKLLEGPGRCMYFQYCKCYKAMVIDEEKRWRKHWKTVSEERLLGLREGRLIAIGDLLISRQYKKAEESVGRLIEEYPNDIRSLALWGEVLLENNDFQGAEKVLLSAQSNNLDSDNDSWIWRILGKVYCRLSFRAETSARRGELSLKAKGYISRALDSAVQEGNKTDAGRACYELALLEYFLNNYQQALGWVNAALSYEPSNEFYRESSRKVKLQMSLLEVDVNEALKSGTVKGKLVRFIEDMHRDRGFISFPECMTEDEKSAFDGINALIEGRQYHSVINKAGRFREEFPCVRFFPVLAAAALIELNRLDEAEDGLISVRRDIFSPAEKFRVERSLGRIYRLRFELPAKEEAKQSYYERSLCYFSRAIQFAFTNNNRADLASTFGETAHLFVDSGRCALAKECLDIADEFGFNNDYLDNLKRRVKHKLE